jgi:hypothetical protein
MFGCGVSGNNRTSLGNILQDSVQAVMATAESRELEAASAMFEWDRP